MAEGGSLKTYVKVAESGRRRALGFCPECGTRIVAQPPQGGQGIVSLRVGSIRQRAELRPRAQLWTRPAQAWIDGLADLPKLEKQR